MLKNSKSISLILTLSIILSCFLSLPVSAEKENINHGFRIISSENIDNIKSTIITYEHIKSGANLIHMKNNDDQKFFSINFKTPPSDNTGVNHIIEHSVLCGSKNYPVKQPIAQMLNRSMGELIIASTWQDYTSYTADSTSQKDLENLISVFLDGVFYPNMIEEPNIFNSEGWCYELDSEESDIRINGIAYNEMKNMYSDPGVLLMQAIKESLFPDTSYRWEAGGLPEEIPTLTREKLIQTYKEYYKPSNSLIFLYGNVEIDRILKLTNDGYLSKFDKEKINISIDYQKPFKSPKTFVGEYGVSQESDIKNKTNISYNYVVSDFSDKETVIGFQILNELLMGDKFSPLRKALEDSRLSGMVSSDFRADGIQPTYRIYINDTEEENKTKIKKIIDDTLLRLSQEGFKEEDVNKVLDFLERRIIPNQNIDPFRYNMRITESWVYGEKSPKFLESKDVFDKIKKKIKSGYLEKLIVKYLLENNHSSSVVLKPVKGLDDKKAMELKESLAKYKASLSDIEINNLINKTKELRQWADTPDSEDALAKLPYLTKEDIDTKVSDFPTEVKEIDKVKVLHHPVPLEGRSNITFYFDTKSIPQDKLSYIKLLSSVLNDIDNDIVSFFGQRFYNVPKNAKMGLNVQVALAKLYNEDISDSLKKFGEIISSVNFNDKERIKNIIHEEKLNLDMDYKDYYYIEYISWGKMNGYLSEENRYASQIVGLDYYKFITNLDKNFDARWDEIQTSLLELKKHIFNQETMVISFLGDQKGYNNLVKSIPSLIENMDDSKYPTAKYDFPLNNKNEGIIMPINLQYVFKGGNFIEEGYEYSPKMKVLENIISSEYLWNEIRVKRGAYGTGAKIREDGKVILYSTQDPNIKETIEAFNGVVDFIRNFKATEQEMINHIIRTITTVKSEINPFGKLNPSLEVIIEDELYFSGVTKNDIKRMYDEILRTTDEDIRGYADMVEKILKQNYISVVGGEQKINENKDLFESIKAFENMIQFK